MLLLQVSKKKKRDVSGLLVGDGYQHALSVRKYTDFICTNQLKIKGDSLNFFSEKYFGMLVAADRYKFCW